MKLGEIIVHMGNYNFTKFHQNQMKNKKHFINSPFFCSEFQSVSRIVKIVHSADYRKKIQKFLSLRLSCNHSDTHLPFGTIFIYLSNLLHHLAFFILHRALWNVYPILSLRATYSKFHSHAYSSIIHA